MLERPVSHALFASSDVLRRPPLSLSGRQGAVVLPCGHPGASVLGPVASRGVAGFSESRAGTREAGRGPGQPGGSGGPGACRLLLARLR